MTSLVGLLQFSALTALLFSGVVALAVAAVYPRWRARLGRLDPARQVRVLRLLAGAPLAIGALQTALCFVPGLLGVLWPTLDHCVAHDHHPHLCFVHLPGTSGALAGWAVATVAVSAYGLPFLREARRLWGAQQVVRGLLQSARPDERLGVLIVESPVILAAATTVSRSVVLSSGLVGALRPELLSTVIAHERSHLARHDAWGRVVAGLLAVGHLPGTRRQLLADLDLAAERAADEEAADCVGSRTRVAEALLAVERLCGAVQLSGAAAAFGGSNIVPRIEALLAPRVAGGANRGDWAWWVGGLVAVAALTDPLHHAAESLLGFLGG